MLTTHTFQEETTDRSHKENFNQNFSSVFSFAWKQTISSVLIHTTYLWTNLLSCVYELEKSSSAKTKKRINLKPSVWNLCTLELKFFQFSKILTSPNEVLLSPEIKMLSCCQNELKMTYILTIVNGDWNVFLETFNLSKKRIVQGKTVDILSAAGLSAGINTHKRAQEVSWWPIWQCFPCYLHILQKKNENWYQREKE